MQFSLAIDPFVADMLCFVLVDDRNLRVADFAQFWATAKVYSVSFKTNYVSFCCLFHVLLGLTKNYAQVQKGYPCGQVAIVVSLALFY